MYIRFTSPFSRQGTIGLQRVLVTLLFVLMASSSESKTVRKEIECDASPIQFSEPISTPPKNKCSWRHHERISDDGNPLGVDRYYRYGEFGFGWGFINVIYDLSLGDTIAIDDDPDEALKRRFKKLREDSTEWSAQSTLEVNEDEFEIYQFRMPNQKRCVGFVRKWLFVHGGWKRVVAGYLCTSLGGLELSKARQILEKVHIRD